MLGEFILIVIKKLKKIHKEIIMKIDLSSSLAFQDDEVVFDKNINFIFGNNGTGKSTIAQFLQKQCEEYDVRVFQGFQSVIGENEELNAVVLGDENLEINKKILEKEALIKKKNTELEDVIKQITDSEKENIYTKKKIKENDFDKKIKEINNFFTTAGAKIKNIENPSIAKTTYNKNDFETEIAIARYLTEAQLNLNKEILDTKVKNAPQINFPKENTDVFLKKVNNILVSKVKEPITISRLNDDDNNDKIEFAKQGLKIHKKGDICSFCNSLVKDEVFDELDTLFSMKDIEDFQSKIEIVSKELEKYITIVTGMSIDVDKFYPDYNERIADLKVSFENIRDNHLSFFETLIKKLNKKSQSLFKPNLEVKLKTPDSFDSIKKSYDKIIIENNNNNLEKKQAQARESIRLHEVQKQLDNFEYNSEVAILAELKKNMEEVNQEYLEKETEVAKIKKEIRKIETKRNRLQAKTKNEKKLALNINKKLKYHVPFELQHIKSQKEKGFYKIKCLRTPGNDNIRSVSSLSTGEKNIISFLYFIEKLKEIDSTNSLKNKIIVFDDPMNSNDATIQYLIVDELQNLLHEVKNNNHDKIFLLTHNKHFYINVKYGFDYPRNYKSYNYMRLFSNNYKTDILKINSAEKDFKTSYKALWNDLIFLYNNKDASPDIMINPLRRIIETYTNFNQINIRKFTGDQTGVLKFLHVNSHSIDDLAADLNVKTKQEIMLLIGERFNKNNALEHFNKYFVENIDEDFAERLNIKTFTN